MICVNLQPCFSLQKILVHPPNKSEKIQGFFWGFKIRTPFLGVNSSSNSVFKSFFIYKILVHQKKFRKIRKIQKIQEK